MAPPAESTGEWYQLVGPTIGITLCGLLAFIGSYFSKKSSDIETTPSGKVAANAVGAAFVDRSTADVATRMAEDIHLIRQIAERWEDREQADERAELAELRRAAKTNNRKD